MLATLLMLKSNLLASAANLAVIANKRHILAVLSRKWLTCHSLKSYCLANIYLKCSLLFQQCRLDHKAIFCVL